MRGKEGEGERREKEEEETGRGGEKRRKEGWMEGHIGNSTVRPKIITAR